MKLFLYEIRKGESMRKNVNVCARLGRIFLPALLLLMFWCGGTHALAATGLSVAPHAQGEIKMVWKKLGINESLSNCYSKKPVATAPYACGELNTQTWYNGLKTLNFIRYVAGIPANVEVKNEYQQQAQAAALINYVNKELSHFPQPAKGMDQSLYELSLRGASSSNLYCVMSTRPLTKEKSLYEALVNGWMADDDAYNISSVGHRRWCLNPTMQYTGFGVAEDSYSAFSAMYAHDESRADGGYRGVAWPAQNMPVELFAKEYPWSISIGEPVDKKTVSVTLKRVKDGKIWKFSAAGSNGYFNVNNDYYGQTGCIIFRPTGIDGYKAGDSFEVAIKGSNLNIFYKVQFFYVHNYIGAHTHKGGTATCRRLAICDLCGSYYGSLAPIISAKNGRWTCPRP